MDLTHLRFEIWLLSAGRIDSFYTCSAVQLTADLNRFELVPNQLVP